MINKIKVVFFTGNRSEFGLISPLIKAVINDEEMDYRLVVSGAHLSGFFGNTINEIINEKIDIHYKIDSEVSGRGKLEIIKETSIILNGVANYLHKEKPDYLFVLGDRYETFAAALAAFYLRIPIAHSGGGNITEGGCLDDTIRHSITRLASLHFVTCEENANNVRKLGEEEWRIIVSGSTVTQFVEFMSKEEVEKTLDIDFNNPVLLFTQHPVASEIKSLKKHIKESLKALEELGYQTVILYPNPDAGGETIIDEFKNWMDVKHFRFKKSLGHRLYLSLMKYSSVVVGNSSSGLLETPIFKVAAVNIGNRQKGRICSSNVINCNYDCKEITEAIQKARFDRVFISQVKNCKSVYGEENTCEIIMSALKKFHLDPGLLLTHS